MAGLLIFLRGNLYQTEFDCINPSALRKAKIVYNFGLSRGNRVKLMVI